MEGFPLSVGGGGNAGPSNRPLLDLNLPPAPEPEPGPEPAPPAPLSAEEEEALRTKRERVKAELRLLLQIGYDKRARSSKTAEDLIRWIGIDAERDPRFLESLYNHLDRLSLTQGGSVVSQWCNAVDLLGKRRKITLISCFGEISGSRGMERNILYLISKSSYSTSSNPGWGIACKNDIMLIHVPHGQGGGGEGGVYIQPRKSGL
ncbi:hypothetical protein FH972_025332 [Carpinus fangiana]|uniref:ATP synthase YMF19 uncharacterized C-terminal domain-containing protein n=1 Tax=Carpinus fangiana TaxID=176857 RepID=A0A5N6L0Q4_9ROSI|nr:hypothetical protein FH972_025332 [Carpinus fangiana]